MEIKVYETIELDTDYDLQSLSLEDLLEMLANNDYEIALDITVDISAPNGCINYTLGGETTLELSKDYVIDRITSDMASFEERISVQAETIRQLREENNKLKDNSVKHAEVHRLQSTGL